MGTFAGPANVYANRPVTLEKSWLSGPVSGSISP
jgi:hypothetical protein